jgi:hypothetical protein
VKICRHPKSQPRSASEAPASKARLLFYTQFGSNVFDLFPINDVNLRVNGWPAGLAPNVTVSIKLGLKRQHALFADTQTKLLPQMACILVSGAIASAAANGVTRARRRRYLLCWSR